MTTPVTASEKRVLIARFSTQNGAESAVSLLKSAGVALGNVAVIEKNESGEVKFTESKDWGLGKSAAVGAVAAMILPGIGLILGAAAGAAAAYFIDAGFPDNLLKEMGTGLLSADQSALVALVQGEHMTSAESTITQAGGSVLGSGTESDLARALEAVRGANPVV
ncbi:MAG: DUF1269 domain-containing protein [Phycisphaerae bacterium]|nr:DUF1269 domain-containing protein [Gemmatimonadaceae bacterium]